MRALVKRWFRLRYLIWLMCIFALVYFHIAAEQEGGFDKHHPKEDFAQIFTSSIINQPNISYSEKGFKLPKQTKKSFFHPIGPLTQNPVTEKTISPSDQSTSSASFKQPVSSSSSFSFTSQPSLHILCSSDCSTYQRWQVLTQIYSAKAIGQPGRYSWLVSGCGDQQKQATIKIVNENFPDLDQRPTVHFTPDFSDMSVYGGPFSDGKTRRSFVNRKKQLVFSPYGNKYKFNNKPNSLLHWSQHRSIEEENMNEVVVLIDPDFLFMAKLEFPEGSVSPGHPAAQNYGLGDQWLSFNLSSICGPSTPCTKATSTDVYTYYSAGPPYLLHSSDIGPFAQEWARLVPRVYDEYPMLYAEMFAYSMAAAQLGLKHQLLSHLMTGCMVGWPKTDLNQLTASVEQFIEKEQGEKNGMNHEHGASSCFVSPMKPPPFLHYCVHYKSAVSDHSFAKRSVPHGILDCTSPSLLKRKDKAPTVNKKVKPQQGRREASWGALAYCAAVRAIDYARDAHCLLSDHNVL